MCSLRSTLITIVGLSASVPWLAVLVWPSEAPGQQTSASSPNQPASKHPADTAQIERLIRQLGSTQFAEREAASKALDALGEPALPALRKVRESADPEVRRRVAALLKSLEQKRLRARDKGLAAIQRFNGSLTTEDGTPNGRTRWVGFTGAATVGAGDAEAAWLPYFDDAQYLVIQDTQISDDGLAYIETFYRLQGMGLHSMKAVTGGGLKHVGKLVTLRTLELNGTPVTDAGLPHLKKLEKLILLDLTNTRITDAGLKHLKKLKALESLDLSRTRITDAGLDHIKELKGLETLNLSHTQVTDVGLAKLKSLKRLEALFLSETQVTDAGLAHLREIQTLYFLRADGTKVTERGKAEWLKRENKHRKETEDGNKAAEAKQNRRAK